MPHARWLRLRGGASDMVFDKLLSKEKGVVLQKWFTHVVETYPPETARFLRKSPTGSPIRWATPFTMPCWGYSMNSPRGRP